MVLLGIDPGLAETGYGVVRSVRQRCVLLDHGCIRTRAGWDIGDRLVHIHDEVSRLLREYRPEALALERLYQLRDGSTGLSVGQAVGVIRLAAAQAGVAVAEYAPTHVKLTLVGNGQAAKHQVQFMVQRVLGLSAPPRPDHAADALALCVCHLNSGLSRSRAGSATALPAGPERVAAALEAERERLELHRQRSENQPT